VHRHSMSRNSVLSATLGGVIALALYAGPAHAQATDKTTADKPAADEIVVTGLRASLRDAINAKRVSKVVTESISAKDIGVLPDVTIADSINRLPGITTSRDRGNASQASVRGLGPRLVLGLINGREVASSEPDRNVRWEIYPSESVSGVTVYKSQGADLIAGGVAATIDIRTLRPLDYVGPKLTVRAGAQYNDAGFTIPKYDGLGTRESAQYVTHLTDTLGLALGGTYQLQSNGYASFQGWGYNNADAGNSPPKLNGSAVYAPWGAQTEVKALKETRWSANGALQWKPDDHWDTSLDFLYSSVKIKEKQFQQWFGGWGDWGGTLPDSIYANGQYTLAGKDIVAANLTNWGTTVTNVIGKYVEDKTLLATGLNTRYRAGDLTIKFDGSYSQARRKNTWAAAEWNVYPQQVAFNTAAGVVPSISTGTDLVTATQASAGYGFTGPQRLNDTLGAVQLDASYALHDGLVRGLNAGVRYSSRIKSFAQYSGSVTLGATPAFTWLSVAGSGVNAPALAYADFDSFAKVNENYSAAAFDKSQYWRVLEKDVEGYAMLDLEGNAGPYPVYGNLGVRFVDVSTTSSAYQGVTQWDSVANANVTTYSPNAITNHYFKALPSINLNFDLSAGLKLRLGAARVMSRPPLDQIRASQNLSYYPSSGFLAGSAGNAKLQPFMATQADASLEWYFHKDALVALAGYYKNVDSNVGYATTPQVIGGTTYQITGPVNGPGGDVKGLEASLSTPFYFVPALKQFGIYANFALVDSNLKELTPATNPFPAVGLTKFTGQFDLWYSAHGVDARVGIKHHSPQTVIFGWDATKLTRLESETQIGASVSYAVTSKITLRLQASNLTNQAARFYYANDPNQLARYEKYGRSYLADVTFKY
jgi:iron complex outermembrane receptor protein